MKCQRNRPECTPVGADVTKAGDVDRMVDQTGEHFGKLDIVFVNAGMFIEDDLLDGDPEHWAAGINLNNTRVCRTLSALISHLVAQRFGHVLISASIAGRR
jgi:NADP-dependent 3-hydroxy acid dehydrogenase YdfG